MSYQNTISAIWNGKTPSDDEMEALDSEIGALTVKALRGGDTAREQVRDLLAPALAALLKSNDESLVPWYYCFAAYSRLFDLVIFTEPRKDTLPAIRTLDDLLKHCQEAAPGITWEIVNQHIEGKGHSVFVSLSPEGTHFQVLSYRNGVQDAADPEQLVNLLHAAL